MITNFPDFTELDFGQKEELQSFIKNFEPYSDFNFTSLYSWNFDGTARLCWLNGNLVINIPDYVTGQPVYSILGDSDIDASLDQLLSNAGQLKLVPQATIDGIRDKSKYLITSDPDNDDYVYSVENLAVLGGQDNRGKRKQISRFTRSFEGRYSVEHMNFEDDGDLAAIIEIARNWYKERSSLDDDPTESAHEMKAIVRLTEQGLALDLLGTIVRIDDRPVGFSIHEKLNNEYAVCHFQKSLLAFKYLDAFLTREGSKQIGQAGVNLVNWEQDLGIEGLKQFKSGYHPLRLLKKYLVSPAQT
jgi:uncharacterized protein